MFQSPLEFFPKAQPREKQTKALDFVMRAVERGYKHIIVEAPTGIGKTAIGVALCRWASCGVPQDFPGARGGYYLVTQKLLQDQLETDFADGPFAVSSLKSASEYECPHAKNCAIGASKKKHPCPSRNPTSGTCAYKLARQAFISNDISVTNYPFFITERTYSGNLPTRRLLLLDECHNLERQILRSVDITVSEENLETWAREVKSVPKLPKLAEFVQWLKERYLPDIEATLSAMVMMADDNALPDKLVKEIFPLQNQVTKTTQAIELIERDPTQWVYWQDKDRDNHLISTARPLNAAPFSGSLFNAGSLVVHMSAFPGSKDIYCRSIGLDPEKVARVGLSSTFDIKNRQVVLALVGSMSMRNVDKTLPSFLRVAEKILTRHHDEKGIIHSNSYKLGEAIFNYFSSTTHSQRLLFPRSADEREELVKQHAESTEPTVLISPSVTEGFDFKDDIARWQIISKCPYPSLSDAQVAKKRELDPEWYALETIKTIVQAAGRICRSDTDYGTTYILDEDFRRLWYEYQDHFPKWFAKAFVWVNKSS